MFWWFLIHFDTLDTFLGLWLQNFKGIYNMNSRANLKNISGRKALPEI